MPIESARSLFWRACAVGQIGCFEFQDRKFLIQQI